MSRARNGSQCLVGWKWRVKGKGQQSKDRLQWAQLVQSRRQEEKAEQDRHLVSWLLVLLWGWDLVESVELDSE